jgi:hypothetical protein
MPSFVAVREKGITTEIRLMLYRKCYVERFQREAEVL